jgi:hypothetical protein
MCLCEARLFHYILLYENRSPTKEGVEYVLNFASVSYKIMLVPSLHELLWDVPFISLLLHT